MIKVTAHCLVLALVLITQCNAETDDDLLLDYFPDGFLWGSATSSYQIEGAYLDDGKIYCYFEF